MTNRAIITYAEGAHEELLEVAYPTFQAFSKKHGYDLFVAKPRQDNLGDVPAAWKKVYFLLDVLETHDEVVWFDCDLVVVDNSEDFQPIDTNNFSHSLVRHFEDFSEVPNSGVWRLNRHAIPLLQDMLKLEVFTNHGWWEQAALMTLMGYTVPAQGSKFADTMCKCVVKTEWYESCQFMRLKWNSHPNYRADNPKIVHCSYPDMQRRIEVMRALVKDPTYCYPKYVPEKEDDNELPD